MYKILCISNRSLSTEPFQDRMKKLAGSDIYGMILREKDLSENEYIKLARQILPLFKDAGPHCILHGFVDAAIYLGHPQIHLPMQTLRSLSDKERSFFTTLGASCHSVAEALEAQELGCTYLTASHIFATDCKKGLEPRGLSFLEDVCSHVDLPVFALGGIHPDNIDLIKTTKAEGACIMSGLMKCENIPDYLRNMI